MRSAAAVALGILLSPFAFSQAPDSNRSGVSPSVDAAPPAPQTQPPAAQPAQPPSYANYSIMLVNPAGGAVVIMHNPKNAMEYVDVSKTKEAFAAGYAPVRAAEFAELLASMKDEVARLSAEITRLQGQQQQAMRAAGPAPSLLSPAEQEAQRRAQAVSEQAARRQQLIQSWLMLQNMNRPQTLNMNVTVSDCTRFPALCAAR